MIPGISLNCLRTSRTILKAALWTAPMRKLEKKKGSSPPMKRPTTTRGSLRANVIEPADGRLYLENRPLIEIWRLTSDWNASKMETAARAADITAKALVVALVVFPMASSSSVTVLTDSSSPAISTMPFALSVMGPKESMDMIIPVSESIDMVATAVL
jgi:hypothetical protein